MDDNSIYYWKKYANNEYENIEGAELCLVPINDFKVLDENVDLSAFSFTKSINQIRISIQLKNKFDELFSKYQVSQFTNELISFGAVLQSSFVNNIHNLDDNLLRDFELESKDLAKLLDCLEDFLFEKNRKDLNSVQFTFLKEKTIPIKNYFVVADIYSAICSGFNISKENFSKRKDELLLNTNKIKVSHHSDYLKNIGIKFLYGFFNEGFKNNDKLRFIGVFLSLCYIPANTNDLEFLNSLSLEDLLKSVNLKNLTHYITRPKKYLN